MQPYRNLSGDSGVIAYEIRPGAIIVQFKGDGDPYTYTDETATAPVVAEMQQLARAGRGLSTFIARNQPGHVR